MTQTLDEIDIKILRALQENCRLTNKELAAKIHLSTTPTFERHKRLEKLGYIRKYSAIIDAEKLDKGFTVFCCIKMTHINNEVAQNLKKAANQWEEVSECYNISGDNDYMMKVHVQSMKQYQEFVLNKISTLEYVGRIQSIFIMDTLKQYYGIPII